ncbi:MAG TPA: hypothetical protein PLY93_15235 [Turneriella sp.]|nr:hypothetical protein [Turneriella sp.]
MIMTALSLHRNSLRRMVIVAVKRFAFVALLSLYAGALFAHVEEGHLGAEFGYGIQDTSGSGPANIRMPTVALWYHLTDWVALNVRGGLSIVSYDSDYNNSEKYSTTVYGASIEMPFYIAKLNAVRLYLAPNVGYTFTKDESFSVSGITGSSQWKTDSLYKYVSFLTVVGLQVAILEQLHVVGRTTFGYVWQNVTYPTSNTYSHSSFFGFQSWSLGAIVYFN